jgi:hypothetical protein
VASFGGLCNFDGETKRHHHERFAAISFHDKEIDLIEPAIETLKSTRVVLGFDPHIT